MSINMETGLWQDFKAHESGNFYHLISLLEGISYSEAVRKINKKLLNNAAELIFSPPPVEAKQLSKNSVAEEFKNFKKIDVAKFYWSDVLYERLAAKFIIDRGLEKGTFYYASEGKYCNRIIIPYMKNGVPYYFQARTLTRNKLKYINPTKAEHGVKSSEILYPFDRSKDYVVITEGPVDALTLQLNGINATSTQGCHISYAQLDMLKGKKLIFSYDNDEAGAIGLKNARQVCLRKNISQLYQTTPPTGFKDWNELHAKKKDPKLLFDILNLNVARMDFEYFATSLLP